MRLPPIAPSTPPFAVLARPQFRARLPLVVRHQEAGSAWNLYERETLHNVMKAREFPQRFVHRFLKPAPVVW